MPTTVRLTGTFTDPAGDRKDGMVYIETVPSPLTDSAGKKILVGKATRWVRNGRMQSAYLIPTDDTVAVPGGFRYRITEHIGGHTRSYLIDLPESAGPTVDLSDLTPIES